METVPVATPPVDTPSGAPQTPAVPAVAEPAFELSKYVGTDGKFLEGWKEGLLSEDLKGLGVYDKVEDVQGLLRQTGMLDRLVGKKGVIVPTENSTQIEIDEFRKAIGVPDSDDGYTQFTQRPEELPKEYWDEELVAEARKMFWENDYTPKQVEAAMKFDNARLLRGIEELAAQKERAHQDADRQLRAELKDGYDTTVQDGNRLISENTEPGEQRDAFLEKYGNDPDFIRFAGKISKRFKEHPGVGGVDVQTSADIASIESEIAKVMAHPAFMDKKHPEQKYMVEKLTKLHKEKAEMQKKT